MNDPLWLLMMVAIWLVFAATCGKIGALIGRRRGLESEGFVLGFVLSGLGWIIVLLLPEAQRPKARAHAGKVDPFLLWDAQEKAKTILPVPEHLRGKVRGNMDADG